jgi:hypothetical protein
MTTAKTTAASSTASSEVSAVDHDQLFAQLELVDRYGEDFTYAELSAIAWDLDTVLRELILQSADERLTVYIQTAKAELQQVLQPAGLTGKPSIRLVVVILLLGRSAMLQARQGFLVTG